MDDRNDKIKLSVYSGRVKLHIFEPSKRKIWTIVGKEKEHWLEPEMQFCSCSGFYFGMIKSNKPCYHIDSVKIAQEKKQYEIIEFSDDEFENFMLSIVNDL